MKMIVIVLLGVAALLAVLGSLWRRRWVDALLVALAAGALGGMAFRFSLPGEMAGAVDAGSADAAAVAGARRVRADGDGLSAARWQDLPARPLDWQAPAAPVLRLAFPHRVALGRSFTLTVRRDVQTPARLQLLAENGEMLADASGRGDLRVQWLPPVAERLVLRARLLDEAGKTIAQGPVPFIVDDAVPLKVEGRFGAPSFDVRALDTLLVNSHALVDAQVVLGKTVTRGETARAALGTPDLLVVDAAWFEQASPASRAAQLARVALGTPLLVLGGNARDASVWARTLGLELRPQPDNARTAGALALSAAPLNPAAARSGLWQGDGEVWSRAWQQGRITWLGVADWHRLAISEPQALALWWQTVLDRAGVRRLEDVSWLDPQEMPLPGQRLALCARGVKGALSLPALRQTLAWERRPEQADASCVAVWPERAGWLEMHTGGGDNAVYVYGPDDWPQWQAAQRRDATARYAARTPAPARPAPWPVPAWPFALLFMAAMLALWWRERR